MSSVAGVLVGMALAACGARAQVGTSGGEGGLGGDGVIANAPGFLFACESSCGEGLSCIDGTCTMACESDEACQTLSVSANCVRRRGSGSARQCAIPCGSDHGCVSLGPGSYCGGAFCVGARLEQMPDGFDTLTLGRALSSAVVASDTECDPTVQVANIEVNRRTRRLTVSTCERVPNSTRYTVERSRRILGDAELDMVDDAYQAVRIRESVGCATGEDTFTLDVQPAMGAVMKFADEDRASCRGPGEPHTGTVVGLEDLYELLLRLGTGG